MVYTYVCELPEFNESYMFAGPALLFLSEQEKLLLDAYVKYYRTLVASCGSPKCYVFVNRPTRDSQECCGKMTFSGLSKIISKTAKKCDSSTKITSRILRRSQITALWKEDPSPAWRMQVATQCGHSLDTASRYYEFSSKVEPGRIVVEKLQSLRTAASIDESEEQPVEQNLREPEEQPVEQNLREPEEEQEHEEPVAAELAGEQTQAQAQGDAEEDREETPSTRSVPIE